MTNNFREENIKKHAGLFRIAEELESLADEMRYVFNNMSKKMDFRRSKVPLYKTIFLYLINNVMQQYNSIRLLCLEGYGQSALIILRSLMENLITAKYMIADKDSVKQRAERFEEYRWVEMKKQLKYWKMEDEIVSDEIAKDILSKETRVLEKVNEFKKRFSAKNLSTWSGVSIEEMARDTDLLADYNLMYKLCCSFSHPSFLGTQLSVKKSPEVTFFSPKPSFANVEVNLKSSIDYFSAFLLMYDFLFKLGMNQKIYDYQKSAKEVFAREKYT